MIWYALDDNGVYLKLNIEGHARYGGKGENIVCAAVSTVSDMAVRGCALYDPNISVEAQSGYLRIVCIKSRETEAILHAALTELNEIKAHYPECFVEE